MSSTQGKPNTGPSIATKDEGDEGTARPSNAQKDPRDWKTGDEPMTGAQASYLQTLSQEAGVEFDASLTKAEASKRIDELQATTGRGQKQQA